MSATYSDAPITTTAHPVDSNVTMGTGIPDADLGHLISATVPDGDSEGRVSNADLSDGAATMPSMNTTDNPLALIVEAHHHIQAAAKAMDALRPCLTDKGQFVADITHTAAVGIGNLTVGQLYPGGAR